MRTFHKCRSINLDESGGLNREKCHLMDRNVTYVRPNKLRNVLRTVKRKKKQHAEPDRIRHKVAAGIHLFMYNREDTQTPDEQRTRTKEKKGKKYFWSEIKQLPREKTMT